MEDYNDDNDSYTEESLNTQSEGYDISCKKVSSNFSTCSSISFDMTSHMLDGSFRSTRTNGEDSKQSEGDLHWARKSHFEGEKNYDCCGPNINSPRPDPVWQSPPPPVPQGINADITGLEITTPVMGNSRKAASPPVVDDSNSDLPVPFFPPYSCYNKETSAYYKVVDDVAPDDDDDDDDFTYESIGSNDDYSISLNDLGQEGKQSSLVSDQHDNYYQSFSTIATMLKSNHRNISGTKPFESDVQCVHELDQSGRQSERSYDDSTLYEVATLGTMETNNKLADVEELEQTVRKANRTVTTDDIIDVQELDDNNSKLNHDALLVGSFDEFTIYDEVTVKTLDSSKDSTTTTSTSSHPWKDEEITVSTYDVESLVESFASIPNTKKEEFFSSKILDDPHQLMTTVKYEIMRS